MNFRDAIHWALDALVSQRLRSFLTVLGIAVGIGAVVLLTSLGEGIHRFILDEFTQFGTNLIGITPGRASTTGMSGALISNVRPLSIDDADALDRIPRIEATVPVVQGNAAVEFDKRSRRTYVFGVDADVPRVWQLAVSRGRFLPADRAADARAYAVLGSRVADELFGNTNPLGRRIRIGGDRYRTIGVMAAKGQMLGFDLDDAVYVPAQRALAMFNRESLMEIDALFAAGSHAGGISERIRTLLIARHGSEDFTIVTQDQMLDVLGSVLGVLTLAVGAIGGISLLVGGVGITTIMTIAVRQRRAEIGLLRALGAGRHGIVALFAIEATLLGAIGGVAGIVLGSGGAWLLETLLPKLPTHTPLAYAILAEALAAVIGLLSGILPARQAARMDPIEALRAE
ncbi:ABC transporter permease [Desulfosarcina ovata]|uniref:ABC transporter permease n=1 Tax=Desulfosarcina ovata subsp. ovata TaxID=2752305 RepID=A0A5K8A6E6_9BACT|nr:ABC transporter permease [Desulfosarcina ovata]BBO87944.1 ABC transporter permease [Desulfosarcina ovata subsp. ovata]